MLKERVKFLRSFDPHGLEQDINNFIEVEAKNVVEVYFLNTVTGHGNEIYYDAYIRYVPNNLKLPNILIFKILHLFDQTLYNIIYSV